MGSEYTPGFVTAPATSTVTCATLSTIVNSGATTSISCEVPRTTKKADVATTIAESASSERFWGEVKEIWLHQERKFSSMEFMAQIVQGFNFSPLRS